MTISEESFQNNYDDTEEHLEFNMNNSNNSNKSFQNNDDMQDDETISEYFEIEDNKSITSAASSEDFRGVNLSDAYKKLNDIIKPG